MSRSDSKLDPTDPRAHLHRNLQRRVLFWLIGICVVLALVLVPISVNAELRLDIARGLGLVPANEGELIATGDSGATLIVIPTEHKHQSSDLTELRFLAAFIAWPESGALRLESLNGGEDLVLPFGSYEHISASPDGRQLYMRGDDLAVLIDVPSVSITAEMPAASSPEVSWDWRTAIWAHGAFICDRVSNTASWIGCFPRPGFASYLAGDWQLDLHRYGNPDEVHEVMRGLGFRPTIGFTEDDTWLYIHNEHGIRRFNVPEITGTD